MYMGSDCYDEDSALLSKAVAFANTVQPSGCNCENNGDWCEWCGAKMTTS